MGTRSLVGVIKDAEWKIAQYTQFDGYPGGVGSTVLQFLRDNDLEEFSKKLDLCFFGTEQQIEKAYAPFTHGDGWMTMDQAAEFKKSKFGYLSRDTGPDILHLVMLATEKMMLSDSSNFAQQSLHCEWAYVIDMDRRVLECYTGFQKSPVPEGQRFFCFNDDTFQEAKTLSEKLSNDFDPTDVYYPVHLVKEYSFDALHIFVP
jgi:hypothetical protein